MVDIAHDPRWGRVSGKVLVKMFSLNANPVPLNVKGFQGDDLSKYNTILACAKHFASYGAFGIIAITTP
jgi:beta-glucosidase